jgi:hypothetical protein
MQQAGTRQGAHRRAPARHLPAGRLALCRSLHTAITRFLGRFSWSCGYKAQAAIEQKLEPTLFGSTLDKSRQTVYSLSRMTLHSPVLVLLMLIGCNG